MKNLNFHENFSWLKSYYEMLLDYHKSKNNNEQSEEMQIEEEHPKSYELDPFLNQLKNKEDADFLFQIAQKLFNNYQINAAFQICQKIYEKDIFHMDNILIFSEILVEKNMISDLFSCSTNMAENYPKHYITFYLFG